MNCGYWLIREFTSYATECFEGMKVYRGHDGKLRLFRPDANCARMVNKPFFVSVPSCSYSCSSPKTSLFPKKKGKKGRAKRPKKKKLITTPPAHLRNAHRPPSLPSPGTRKANPRSPRHRRRKMAPRTKHLPLHPPHADRLRSRPGRRRPPRSHALHHRHFHALPLQARRHASARLAGRRARLARGVWLR